MLAEAGYYHLNWNKQLFYHHVQRLALQNDYHPNHQWKLAVLTIAPQYRTKKQKKESTYLLYSLYFLHHLLLIVRNNKTQLFYETANTKKTQCKVIRKYKEKIAFIKKIALVCPKKN